jgi:hypothetical protein
MQPIVSGASYLPSGPPDSLELGNGLTETRAFDARYHPDRITVAGGSTLLDWDYATDDVGNIQAISDVLDAVNDRTYGYQDYQYFLTQGDGPWGGLDWTYDTIGNRLSEARDGQPADVYDYLENGAGGNLPQLDAIQLGGGGTRRRPLRRPCSTMAGASCASPTAANLIPPATGCSVMVSRAGTRRRGHLVSVGAERPGPPGRSTAWKECCTPSAGRPTSVRRWRIATSSTSVRGRWRRWSWSVAQQRFSI